MWNQIMRPSSLATLRRINEANLPDTAVVLNPTITTAAGRPSTTWADSPTSVACRVRALSKATQEVIVAGELKAVPTFLVVMQAGTAVDTTKRLRVSGKTKGVIWQRTLEVVGVGAPESYESMRRVYCTELVTS